MISSADTHQAVSSLWNTSALDDKFKAHWTASQQSSFLVLHDSEAAPNQPWPYAIFEIPRAFRQSRSTGGMTCVRSREIRVLPLSFHIHARNAGSHSAKALAADLAEQVMKVYGGHPEVPPQSMTLTHGNVILCQHANDYGVKTGDEEYLWIVDYQVTVDIPVKIV